MTEALISAVVGCQVLFLRKQSEAEIKQHAQSHTANQWYKRKQNSWNQVPALLLQIVDHILQSSYLS